MQVSKTIQSPNSVASIRIFCESRLDSMHDEFLIEFGGRCQLRNGLTKVGLQAQRSRPESSACRLSNMDELCAKSLGCESYGGAMRVINFT